MIRLGVDFGGTKIEAAALAADGEVLARERLANPGNYQDAIEVVAKLVGLIEAQTGQSGLPVGVGVPGSISPVSGLMRNANSVWLNGRPFREDLERRLGASVRLRNDADCFTLSEAIDGAAAGASSAFGVIIGTGCGGGVAVNGRLLESPNGIAGEWGHTPLPWASEHEFGATTCWCGRTGCLETWISGTGFADDYRRGTGRSEAGPGIVAAAEAGDSQAAVALDRYVSRLARGLAVICDILDPAVIVLGGGMSKVEALYRRLPEAIAGHVFADRFVTPVVKARWGDSSGVRGAAWLWP